MKRLRWHGDPADQEQPDAGDVLTSSHHTGGPEIGRPAILRVLSARELTRGPNAHKPHELALTVEETDVSAWSDQDASHYVFVWDRGDR